VGIWLIAALLDRKDESIASQGSVADVNLEDWKFEKAFIGCKPYCIQMQICYLYLPLFSDLTWLRTTTSIVPFRALASEHDHTGFVGWKGTSTWE